jgi:CRISPR-associated endonuclease/helicase Cas3
VPLKLEPNLLLAKSFQKGYWKGSYGLIGHTADVVNALTIAIDTLGERLLEQFRLQCTFSQLRATARLAGYIHDWGKTNEHFQMVVRHQRNPLDRPQLIRHEVVSVLLAWQFREWLELGEGDFFIALAAAGGHHLKLGGRSGKCTDELGEIRQSGDDKLELYLFDAFGKWNPRFCQLLKYGSKTLNLPDKIKLSRRPSSTWSIRYIKEQRLEIVDCLSNQWQCEPVFLAIIKALLIACDAIASAFPTTGLSMKQWMREEIQRGLDLTKIQKIIDARLNGKELLPFQRDLARSCTRVTLLQAGCGMGKTLGAYNWAKSQAVGKKLIFCYPTTGTSTEGFLDYVDDIVDSVLLHSRADFDLEMATTGEEEEVGEEINNEIAIKLDSFKAWGREVIICTVDSVLGLLQCNRRPIYSFPAIARAAFVFDEVHCYDNCLFGALLRFLEVVKAPILLMSASFLPWQKQAIEKAVGERITIISGPEELERQPRYYFNYVESPDWQRIEREIVARGKILWVCNQVNTAISVYRQAQQRNINCLLYHSRFRYRDRIRHHRELVDAFKVDNDRSVLAITTQVAEMSLDISATLLISELAPPASLIQRLGRLNRRYCGHPKEAIFYPPYKGLAPYTQEESDRGLELIKSFQVNVCQQDLAKWLESSDAISQPITNSVLLDGGWRTYSTSLREEGFNITALLECDRESFHSLSIKKLAGYTIPIPAKNIKHWARYKYYPIAPQQEWGYSAELGAYQIK